MDLTQKCLISYYVQIASINPQHNIDLVQHAETGKIYVRKTTEFYNMSVYKNLMQVPCPGMPRIYDLFEEDNTLTIIEEFISGDTFEELLQKNTRFNEQQVTSWMLQLCRIVKDLHGRNPSIIHRDIKPSNVMLTPDGTIRLLDLSAARRSDGNKTQDTVIMGTAGYAAPEQYGFSTSSAATDIYSIGILMNKLLTGKLLNESVYTGPLSDIIDKCTQIDPQNRYADIRMLIEAIENYPCGNRKAIEKSVYTYLPPGFRSGNIISSAAAAAGYIFTLYISLTLKVKATSVRMLWVNRIAVAIMFILMILLSGNYLNCQKYLPLASSKNPMIRLLGVIGWNVLLFISCAVIVAIIEK